MAARRSHITTVLIIPHDNEKDLEDILDNIKEHFNIIPVKTVDDVFKYALKR